MAHMQAKSVLDTKDEHALKASCIPQWLPCCRGPFMNVYVCVTKYNRQGTWTTLCMKEKSGSCRIQGRHISLHEATIDSLGQQEVLWGRPQRFSAWTLGPCCALLVRGPPEFTEFTELNHRLIGIKSERHSLVSCNKALTGQPSSHSTVSVEISGVMNL
jgi:hypothetical protein